MAWAAWLARLAAGLGLVLLALRQASEAGAAGAGSPGLARAVRAAGGRPLGAFLVGLAGTLLLGSSSAWVILLEGLADAGVLELPAAVAMVLGANVGSTASAHLMAVALPWPAGLALWALGRLAFRRLRGPARRATAGAAAATGALLAGLDLLGQAARLALEGTGGADRWATLLETGAGGAGRGFLLGVAATAAAFSSAFTVGLLEELLGAGLLSFGQALPVLLGNDLGTVADTLIAAAAAGRRGRAVAAAQLLFNLAADLAWLLLGRQGLEAATAGLAGEPAARLAVAYTLLNLAAALPALLLHRPLARWAYRLAPGARPGG
ncbi:MAG: Na/Pi symporter [Bacillota bacterium]|nr:Na/Pi symporter [Bacillota bacterium]